MTYSEFRMFEEDLMKFCGTTTRNVEAQLGFNKLVAEKLGLETFREKASSKDVVEDVSIA